MNFIRHGLYNIFIYGCGLVIVNGLSFAMLPFYTRVFRPEEYALITLVLTCLPFTRYCFPMEISQAAPVFSADDSDRSQYYISIGFWFTLVMNMFWYCLLFFVNKLWHFVTISSVDLIVIFSLFCIDCLFYYTSNVLRWDIRPILFNSIISGVAILEVILCLIFIVTFKLSVMGIFYAWLVSRSCGLVITLLVNRRKYVFVFHFTVLKKMLLFSMPLFLSNLAYNLGRSLDRLMIVSFIGLSAVGIYGAGATLGGVINFIMGSIAAALTPFVYRNNEKKEAPTEIVQLFYIVITLCMIVAMFFALFYKDILRVLVSEVYYHQLEAYPIVPFIVLSAILSGLTSFAPGIAIKKKTIYVIWFNLLSLIINFVLAYALVDYFGLSGIAFASLCSICCNVILYMIISQKFYYLPFHFYHLLSIFLLFASFYIGGVWLGINYSSLYLNSMLIRSTYYLVFILISLFWVGKIYKDLAASINNKFFYKFAVD